METTPVYTHKHTRRVAVTESNPDKDPDTNTLAGITAKMQTDRGKRRKWK